MQEKDKSLLNESGITVSPRTWKPTNALEKTERNISLCAISLGH